MTKQQKQNLEEAMRSMPFMLGMALLGLNEVHAQQAIEWLDYHKRWIIPVAIIRLLKDRGIPPE
ncbi:MAG TPA: hypothetical protein VFB28_03855 [Terriglobales bacterium]|nr:hypothetical protein [Terriglobales bacterium]